MNSTDADLSILVREARHEVHYFGVTLSVRKPPNGHSLAQMVNLLGYAVDPWGMSYWLHSERLEDGTVRIIVYSFGANRRRDGGEIRPGAATSSAQGDDIMASANLKDAEAAEPPPVFSVDSQ